MRLAISRSWVLALIAMASAFAAAPAQASDAPTAFTATARSDHQVQLSWSWPASPTYPDELDIRRDGALLSTVSPSDGTFSDVVSGAGSTHTYELVPVNGGVSEAPLSATVTLRADLPNKPTNLAVVFDANNVATVTWTRGAADADVTYTVTAQQVGGSLTTGTVRNAGSLTMNVFASYTDYVFRVSAVEDIGDPPGDPGGTVSADAPLTVRSHDVIPPQFGATLQLSAVRESLGTLTVTWPAATDAGSGVAGYTVCVDVSNCSPFQPAQPLEATQTVSVAGIRNDGANHSVTVVAKDLENNLSAPIGTSTVMPIPAKPAIEFANGSSGCNPLIAHATSSDTPTPAFKLYVDGTDTPLDTEITGTPYQQVSLVAQASTPPDLSLPSTAVLARVFDPSPPDASPQARGVASPAASTETLSWDPVLAQGAPVAYYLVAISTLPGYENGVAVAQSDHPSITIPGLANSDKYIAQITAVDACNRPGPPTARSFKLDDITGPSAPALNVPTSDGSSIHLSWAPSVDNVDVADYMVYQDGRFLTRTPNTFYDVTGLNDTFSASYYVIATDFAGNTSTASATRTATTKDMTPPNPPGLIFPKLNKGGTVTLGWPAATDNVGVVGYQVVRNGSPVQNVTSTSFTDRNLKTGHYDYEVRAYDAANLLSAPQRYSVDVVGASSATAASVVRVVTSKGTKLLRVGGKAGASIVLSFTIPQTINSASLRLNVLKSVPMTKPTGNAKRRVTLKAKLRVSLPARSGSTEVGKRLAERAAKKGTITIPLKAQKAGTLRLIVTATGGVLTISGRSAGTKAPTIVPAGS